MNNGQSRIDWIDTLAGVLNRRPSFEHIWHAREQNRYPLHPAVREAVMLTSPIDWHLLVLQWPHVSIQDAARLAYTRNCEHGAADRQTVTSIPKYLAQHFPNLQSHIVRDICAKFGSHEFRITHDLDQMLEWLAKSPKSCMRWDGWSEGNFHPYKAYDPRFGWGMAVRIDSGEIMARALVNEQEKCFVRSFGAVDNDRGHSQCDSALNSWLQAQGYSYDNSWSGCKLARIERHGELVAPYIDGDSQHVDDCGDHLVICDDGEYECTSTSGTAECVNGSHCEHCDSRIGRNDNSFWSGRYEDRLICESCCDEHYVFAYGVNGNQYYERYDDCTNIGDEYYVDRYFSDNNIVFAQDANEYMHQDDCVYLENRGEWVSSDCSYAVFCDDTGTNEHADDCVLNDDGEYTLKTENKAAA